MSSLWVHVWVCARGECVLLEKRHRKGHFTQMTKTMPSHLHMLVSSRAKSFGFIRLNLVVLEFSSTSPKPQQIYIPYLYYWKQIL